MKKIWTFAYLRWFSLIFILFQVVHAEQIKIPLKDFTFREPTLRGIQSEFNIKVPIPSRYTVNKITLHLEIEKSTALVKERSSISVFFNKKLVYQKPFDPLVDIIIADINLPLSDLEPYNDLTIRGIHHYCINCCEFEGSPELWSKVDLNNSYVTIDYQEKQILPDTLLIRDYVMDQKLYNPVNLSILTENKSDFFLSLAGKLAGYIGNYIKYRKINIDYVTNLPEDRDLFIIGSKDFIKKLFGDILDYVPDIGIIPNPHNSKKAIIFITGEDRESIKKSLYAFMSVKNELYTGTDYLVNSIGIPDTKNYSALTSVPFGKKVYLKDLGYEDFKFTGIFPPPAIIEFKIPQGIFIEKNKKLIFHLAYNYGAGTREDSVINIYLNDRYVTSLKMEKKYGIILREEDIKIPVYLLQGGINRLKIEYAMMAPGGGFCISPNIETLKGTLFSGRSYIMVPQMPLWIEMPYLEYFIDSAFPFSLEGGLADTLIYLSSKDDKYISTALTLCAYMGTKIFLPPYKLEFSSDINHDMDKNLIYIGSKIPDSLQTNLGFRIGSDTIDGDIPLTKSILNNGMLKNLLRVIFGSKEDNDSIKAKLVYSNRLTDQVFLIMAQSPFNDQKTVLFLYSKNPEYLYKSVSNFFEPKFSGQIKGDISIFDFYENIYFSDNVNKKYYVGNLSFLQRIMYTVGFSPTLFALSTVALVVIISILLKKVLDYREKKRLEGEV